MTKDFSAITTIKTMQMRTLSLNIKRTKYFQTEIYTQQVSFKRKVKQYLSNIYKMREIMTNRPAL